MSYCPSQDWDRFICEQDDQAEAEMDFYKTYRSEIVQLCAGFLANPDTFHDADMTKESIVDLAAKIMQEIVCRGGEDC